MHDIVIKNGSLIDGTGAPGRVADVAIDHDKITAVGKVGAGKREFNAEGLLVTPGFVDFHTHYDGQVTWDPYLTPSGWHGCTTIVMGNCGVGFAPVKKHQRDWIIGVMEGVEDIPGAALSEGIQWGWETFPEYLNAIEKIPHAIDFGTQVPHSALRAFVMGEKGAEDEAASEDDIKQMNTLLREALRAGALGFSTSRTMLHKSSAGVLVAGTFATREELFGLGEALKAEQAGVYQMALEHSNVPNDVEWMRELAIMTNRPVVFSLSQTDQTGDMWKSVIKQVEEANAAGTKLYCQVAGRSIGILMNWDLTAHPFATHPSFQKIAALDHEGKMKALKDPAFREQLISEKPIHIGDFETFVTQSFHKMFSLKDGINYEPNGSESVAAIAKASGKRPQEVAFDLMMEQDGHAMIYFPLFNYKDENLDLLYQLHMHPSTFMGLSDGGAHCGAICDGGMPTFMLTHWTRDRTRGPKMPLEHVIKRQTRDTAHFYGMHDRGVIAPGLKADVNLIDYQNLGFTQPLLVRDLPAKGRRLVQKSRGYAATICSGKVIVENSEFTGELPGKLVRGARGENQ